MYYCWVRGRKDPRAVSRERMTVMNMRACPFADDYTIIVTDTWIGDEHSNADLCDLRNKLDCHGSWPPTVKRI